MVMVLSLLAYLEKPRPLPIVILAAASGLSLASGPIATSTLFALVAFLALEATWRRDGAVSSGIATFRGTRDHWQLAALALALRLVTTAGDLLTALLGHSLPLPENPDAPPAGAEGGA